MSSRREFVRFAAAGVSLAAARAYSKDRNADEALRDLIRGNERFSKGQVAGPTPARGFPRPCRGAVSRSGNRQLRRFARRARDPV